MTVRLKEECRKNQASKAYLAILQNNNGYGLVNQGNIMWMEKKIHQTKMPYAKTKDKSSNDLSFKPN